jgi:hypothetical protein
VHSNEIGQPRSQKSSARRAAKTASRYCVKYVVILEMEPEHHPPLQPSGVLSGPSRKPKPAARLCQERSSANLDDNGFRPAHFGHCQNVTISGTPPRVGSGLCDDWDRVLPRINHGKRPALSSCPFASRPDDDSRRRPDAARTAEIVAAAKRLPADHRWRAPSRDIFAAAARLAGGGGSRSDPSILVAKDKLSC